MYTFDQEIEHGELLGAATWSISECLRRKEAMKGNYGRALEKCRAAKQNCDQRLENVALSERTRVLQALLDETKLEVREIEEKINGAVLDAEEYRNSYKIREEIRENNASRNVYNGIVKELTDVLAFSRKKNEELDAKLEERRSFFEKLTAGLGEVNGLIRRGVENSEKEKKIYQASAEEIEFKNRKQLEFIGEMEKKLMKTNKKVEKCLADKIEFQEMVEGIEKHLEKSGILSLTQSND